MARTVQAKVRTFAIFVKELRNDRSTVPNKRSSVYIRRPYNIVEYDWSDGNPVKTYLQPAGLRLPRGGGEPAVSSSIDSIPVGLEGSVRTQEVYDDVRIYDTPPDFDMIYGRSQR